MICSFENGSLTFSLHSPQVYFNFMLSLMYLFSNLIFIKCSSFHLCLHVLLFLGVILQCCYLFIYSSSLIFNVVVYFCSLNLFPAAFSRVCVIILKILYSLYCILPKKYSKHICTYLCTFMCVYIYIYITKNQATRKYKTFVNTVFPLTSNSVCNSISVNSATLSVSLGGCPGMHLPSKCQSWLVLLTVVPTCLDNWVTI